MRFRDFTIMGIGAMLLFQLATSFAAINLLTRMSPAIEKILKENDVSIAAAERMFASLINVGDLEIRKKNFTDALDLAEKNITEPGEGQILSDIRRNFGAAFNEELISKTSVYESIHQLVEINRRSMLRADDEAKRLGNAGAWTMAFLGIAGFFAWILVLRKINRLITVPLEEIRNVLVAHTEGHLQRRIFLRNAVPDLQETASLVNKLLDSKKKIHLAEQEPK